MLITNPHKKYKKKYAYGGSEIFDVVSSILTSDAAKQIGTQLVKTAGTKLVEKGIEKVFQPKKPKITKESQAILDSMLNKQSVPIQNYVKGSGIKIC